MRQRVYIEQEEEEEEEEEERGRATEKGGAHAGASLFDLIQERRQAGCVRCRKGIATERDRAEEEEEEEEEENLITERRQTECVLCSTGRGCAEERRWGAAAP